MRARYVSHYTNRDCINFEKLCLILHFDGLAGGGGIVGLLAAEL